MAASTNIPSDLNIIQSDDLLLRTQSYLQADQDADPELGASLSTELRDRVTELRGLSPFLQGAEGQELAQRIKLTAKAQQDLNHLLAQQRAPLQPRVDVLLPAYAPVDGDDEMLRALAASTAESQTFYKSDVQPALDAFASSVEWGILNELNSQREVLETFVDEMSGGQKATFKAAVEILTQRNNDEDEKSFAPTQSVGVTSSAPTVVRSAHSHVRAAPVAAAVAGSAIDSTRRPPAPVNAPTDLSAAMALLSLATAQPVVVSATVVADVAEEEETAEAVEPAPMPLMVVQQQKLEGFIQALSSDKQLTPARISQLKRIQQELAPLQYRMGDTEDAYLEAAGKLLSLA